MLARGLEQVFGVIQLIDKTVRGIVAFERGQVFAVSGLRRLRRFASCFFDSAMRLVEVGEFGLRVEDGLELCFGIGNALDEFEQIGVGVLTGIDGDAGVFGAALADFELLGRSAA